MRAQVPQCLQLLAPLRPSLLVRVPVCGQLGLHTASGATSQPFLSSSAASPALPKTLTLMYSVLRANRSAQALARNRWAGTLAGRPRGPWLRTSAEHAGRTGCYATSAPVPPAGLHLGSEQAKNVDGPQVTGK